MHAAQVKLAYTLILLFCYGATSAQWTQLIPSRSQHFYKVTNKVAIADLVQAAGKAETKYIFEAQLQINSVWSDDQDQLLQVYFSDARVSTKTARKQLETQEITQMPDKPFYVLLVDGGRPSHVIAHTSRDQSLLNLEAGIVSLLQLRYTNGPVTEVDVSGQCNVFYSVKSSTRLEKTKTDCSLWDLKVNYRPEKPLSVSQHSRENIEYDLSADGLLLKAASKETHRMVLESIPDVGSVVTSELLLEHVAAGPPDSVEQLKFATSNEAVMSLLDWYRIFDIQADVDGTLSQIKHKNLKKEIARFSVQLASEYIGRANLSAAFVQLLPLVRIAKKSDLVEILHRHKDLQPQLVDLFGAAQTIEAHAAIHEVFQYGQQADSDMLEKYLQSLAVGSHPELDIVEHLFEQLQKSIKNIHLLDTLIQTVSALCRQAGFDPNDPLLVNIRAHFTRQLVPTSTAGCTDDDCKLLYIRALQNLQDPDTIPLLLQYALDNTNSQLSVAAMQALKSFPAVYFRERHRKMFADIFYQRRAKYDSSARTLALDILLALKPAEHQLGQMLDFLASNDRQFEIKTFVVQKLRMLAAQCPRFRANLSTCLAKRPAVNNYDVMAQKGLSTVLMRQLSRTPAFNESLLSVQEIQQGVLKRGSVEFILSAGREETSTFKLGLYTKGLSSFVNSDDQDLTEEQDDSPATAGMEISVQGTLLRPLVFFSGQSELMGHVWSGTASEPMPAYQGTTLSQNHEHFVILSSGATAFTRILGAQSIDLNGRVELSIWNRNANTEIQKNTGIAVLGHTIAGFTYARVESKFSIIHEPKISLQADIDFYSDMKLCMQLQHPEVTLSYSNTRSVTLKAAKSYSKMVHSKYSHKSAGFTLALNQKNNEMCNMIFS